MSSNSEQFDSVFDKHDCIEDNVKFFFDSVLLKKVPKKSIVKKMSKKMLGKGVKIRIEKS